VLYLLKIPIPGRDLWYISLRTGITVFNRRCHPHQLQYTTTLFPGGTIAIPVVSNAFKNLGTIRVAVPTNLAE
jgi:hypothetical protein